MTDSPRWLWLPRLLIAGILGQTLYFKFTGAPEAVALFTKLGVEPWGRLGLGVAEALLTVGVLLPRTYLLAGLGTVGLMSGAVFSHLTVLGIETNGDGGALFFMALVAMASGAAISWSRRRALPVVGRWFQDHAGARP